ncbi:hypothetical protein BD413DRAFT_177740 [Trametes elegans]|nr:hypothetical protein BD413DRAFT_177740 [Trametes elegans]
MTGFKGPHCRERVPDNSDGMSEPSRSPPTRWLLACRASPHACGHSGLVQRMQFFLSKAPVHPSQRFHGLASLIVIVPFKSYRTRTPRMLDPLAAGKLHNAAHALSASTICLAVLAASVKGALVLLPMENDSDGLLSSRNKPPWGRILKKCYDAAAARPLCDALHSSPAARRTKPDAHPNTSHVHTKYSCLRSDAVMSALMRTVGRSGAAASKWAAQAPRTL